MHDTQIFSKEYGGRTLTLETGKLAQLATGAVRAQYGDTVVLATVTMSSNIREGIDFFPLSVEYNENLYAAGKIKGSRFIKREGRPSDLAILNARITDRSLRPLFDDHIRNEIQVVLNVLSVDQENDPAYIALIAASAALTISPIPWDGPIAGLSVAAINNEFVLNPTPEQRKQAQLFMLTAVRQGQIVMIEAEGKEAPEDVSLRALEFVMEQAKPVLELINEMRSKIGVTKITPQTTTRTPEQESQYQQVAGQVREYLNSHIASLFGIRGKPERLAKENDMRSTIKQMFTTAEEQAIALTIFDEVYENTFRTLLLEKEIRVDGRKLDEIRPLYCEVDVLPRTHGSALFQRGETQVLSTVTLGAPGDAQTIDGLAPEYEKRFMHHYDFPPFSVGEVKPMRGPSRRDIGHGALAEKALEPMIPEKEKFPYTIRLVSEVLMSNGSSSQASACGSSLALMAAGVPVAKAVAGIAMGLVTTADHSKYKIITDIQGVEDHSGDMDFKVAGTQQGVTAIQLDIKLGGITLDICRDTLTAAKKARQQILEVMSKAIPAPRAELSPYAPRIETILISPDKIGGLIGPGGKNINKIIEETGVQIDIEDDGHVFVTAVKAEGMTKAKKLILAATHDVEVGEVITGPITQIVKNRMSGEEIGAIVDLGGGKDGMVHISEICHKRIANISSALKVGDKITVQVVEVDKEKGRVALSRKACITPGIPDEVCSRAAAMPARDFESGQGGMRGGRGGHSQPPRRSFDRDRRDRGGRED